MFKYIKSESGQTMVLVALMLVVLLGFGALAIDVGAMTFQRSSLQNAADSAALAGALLVPQAYGHDVVKEEMKVYAESNFKTDSTVSYNPDISIDINNRTVDITINQNVPKFLGGVLSDETKIMTVYAKAKYKSLWGGEALPFVNLADKYNDGAVSLWGKVAPGSFEVLDTGEFEDKGDAIILTNWMDGLKLGNGNLGQGQGGKTVLDICQIGSVVYTFSLSDEAIQKVLDSKNGSHYYYRGTKLNDKPNILLEDLVLIKGEVLSTEKDSNKLRIDLNVLEVYDINEGEYPDDYVSKYAKTTSSLIE